ncbi:putative serine/threonine-protein kinase PBL26 [Sesamum alatum]|uniref:Serine/threonine-protein kinase PBL26 n=1 Tax=Sesamum alatum TaxID=300844 RepID=A0AAE2CZZ8_9LAMI|nr:putative serine/threonine-protein kinase PBL26 [Sesamum alatum]
MQNHNRDKDGGHSKSFLPTIALSRPRRCYTMEDCPIELRFENFRLYSDNISDRDYIDEFQFGKVYHGKVTFQGSTQPSLPSCNRFVSPPASVGTQTIGTKECPIKLRFEDLRLYTDNFSDRNYIGKFQYGKVYHGKVPLQGSAEPKPVTVKIWQFLSDDTLYNSQIASRFMDEVIFLQQQEVLHPGLMKLYGYCCEADQYGVVYDFKSFNTVDNLVLRDDFTWWQRIKVALRFAQLLSFLHVQNLGERPFLIRNISAAHIMVDEDWNPKLYDFSQITGGIFPDKTKYSHQCHTGCVGAIEPRGFWSHRSDEYAFGVVLLGLITKEVYTEEDRKNLNPCLIERAFEKYECDRERVGDENFRFSLVHKSFEADPSFCASDAPNITRLALYCVNDYPYNRPRLDEVVNWLQQLKVVRHHLRVYIERGKSKHSLFHSK